MTEASCSPEDRSAEVLVGQISDLLEAPGTEYLPAESITDLARRSDVITTGVLIPGENASDIYGALRITSKRQILKGEDLVDDLGESSDTNSFYLGIENKDELTSFPIDDKQTYHFVAFLTQGEGFDVIPEGLWISCGQNSDAYVALHSSRDAEIFGALTLDEILQEVSDSDGLPAAEKPDQFVIPEVPEPTTLDVEIDLSDVVCANGLSIEAAGINWQITIDSSTTWPAEWLEQGVVSGSFNMDGRRGIFTSADGVKLEFTSGPVIQPCYSLPE